MKQIVHGSVQSTDPANPWCVSSRMELDGTKIRVMAYTFPEVVTVAEVMALDFLKSFHASGLFEPPILSVDGRTATFVRRTDAP